MSNTPTNNKATYKKVGIITAAAIIVLGSGALAIAMWPAPVPPPTASAEELVKFAATDKFAKLPAAQKKPYVDALEKLSFDDRRKAAEALPEDQRREAFRNGMEAAMTERVNNYFALQTPAERTKYLDQMIDEMEKRRAQFANFRPPNAGQQGQPDGQRREGGDRPQGNRDPAARQKSRLENSDPATRQKMADFMAAVRERREQRGLPPMGGPGGRGGFGR